MRSQTLGLRIWRITAFWALLVGAAWNRTKRRRVEPWLISLHSFERVSLRHTPTNPLDHPDGAHLSWKVRTDRSVLATTATSTLGHHSPP